MAKTFELNTFRTMLRAAEAGDVEPLNVAFSDPEVMRYWSEPPHPSIERSREWVSSMINSPGNGVTDFIICLKPDLTPIGKIGVWQDQEIGFLPRRKQWGKGLAVEALGVIPPHLFEERHFSHLTADIDPRNIASGSLLRKMGFENDGYKEKTLQVGDEWVDSQYLKLTKEQWQATNSAPKQRR